MKSKTENGSWLVALDIDGTIMHENGLISAEVAHAIAEVVARGHLVTLATGRSWANTWTVLDELQLKPEFVVTANGAMVLQRGENGYQSIHVETFDPTAVLLQIRKFLPGGHYLVELADGFRLYTSGLQDWVLERAQEVDFVGLLHQQVIRVAVSSPDHDTEEFFELVDQMGLHHVSYSIGWTAWLDIASDGVNKASALELVRDWLGVLRSQVIVVGDGRNDVEMFEWAAAGGRAVAMGQAPDDVKVLANEVTGTIDEDGLAAVLRTICPS